MYVYLTRLAPNYLYFSQDNLIEFLQRFKCTTISEALIGPIGAEEVGTETLEEDVDGPLPPLDHRVASPGESGS